MAFQRRHRFRFAARIQEFHFVGLGLGIAMNHGAGISGREIVLGVAGRFWRPTGNILPFCEEHFRGPVSAGLARAVWNFAVQNVGAGSSILSTETRVVCGDPASRLKFRSYWLVVGHFSGLIRRLMLKSVKQLCERN